MIAKPPTTTSRTSSFDDFEILKKLGQGAQGVVYKVRRKEDQNAYVLKQISKGSMHQKQRRDCLNEAILLSEMNSPFIVRYYDSFLENNQLNIIMEYCEQGDLENFIKNQMGRPISEKKIWRFFFQIAEGLHELHSKNILHRDIKCMNIFLTNNEEIRIGDLGVAKQLTSAKTHAHNQVGTPYYMSPEILQDIPYNQKSDVWSLGCVLYELATQKRPFEAQNSSSLVIKIQRAQYPPIPSTYSVQLKNLIEECLTKDHLKRPTISQLLNNPEIEVRSKQIGYSIKQLRISSQVQSSSEFVLFSNSRKNHSTDPNQRQAKKSEIITSPKITILPGDKLSSDNFSDQTSSGLNEKKNEDPLLFRLRSSVGFLPLSSPKPTISIPSQPSNAILSKLVYFNTNFMNINFNQTNFVKQDQKISIQRLQTHSQSQKDLFSVNSMMFDGIRQKPEIDTQNDRSSQKSIPARQELIRFSAEKISSKQNEPKSQGEINSKNQKSKETLISRYDSLQQGLVFKQFQQYPQKSSKFERCTTLHLPIKTEQNDFQNKQKNNFLAPSCSINPDIFHSAQQIDKLYSNIQQISVSSIRNNESKMKSDPLKQMELGNKTLSGFRQQQLLPIPRVKSQAGSPRPQYMMTNLNRQKDQQANLTLKRQSSLIINDKNEAQRKVEKPIEVKHSINPQLQKLYKQQFDYSVQKQALVKTCVVGLGQKLFHDSFQVFQEAVNRDEEFSLKYHDQIQDLIDKTLGNQREYSKHFYSLISIQNMNMKIEEQISLLEAQLKL